MDRSRQQNVSYTLRLSRVAETGVWRATVYCAQTGERHHFIDLAQLYAFLQQATIDLETDESDAPSG